MNWDAIGALGEVIGAIAVFITLVYLTFQIRLNTKSVKAAAVQAAMTSASSTYAALAYDAEMSRIYWEGLSDFKSLPRDERRRFAEARRRLGPAQVTDDALEGHLTGLLVRESFHGFYCSLTVR